MTSGFGRGRSFSRGFGGGMGFGFRGTSPPWPYVGKGRGGLPRCGYFSSSAGTPVAPQMGREQELDYLKSLSKSLRDNLKDLETRIQEIESKKE